MSQPDALNDDAVTLLELNRHYIRAVQESDVKWFAENLTEDFLNTNPDCTLVDRAGFLTQIAPPCAVSNLRCDEVCLRIIGDITIIHARTLYTKPDGQTGAGRYTDIWARREGGWRCVAAHVSRG